MKSKKFLYCMIALLLIVSLSQFVHYNYSNQIPIVAVPNEEVAKQITEVILKSAYNEERSASDSYKITYDKREKAWIVISPAPVGSFGWDVKVVIRKKDAKIA